MQKNDRKGKEKGKGKGKEKEKEKEKERETERREDRWREFVNHSISDTKKVMICALYKCGIMTGKN